MRVTGILPGSPVARASFLARAMATARTSAPVLAPLSLGVLERLHLRWPNPQRLVVAFALANDVDACADLLTGRAVDPARLDPDALAKAQQASLVRLVAPASLLNLEAAA